MTLVINLRHARKAKARDDRQRRADSNRLNYGISKAQKLHSKAERDRAARLLDAHAFVNDLKPDRGD